ncbi:MAG TPA: hypothetical protein VM890_08815 [Longimicrobium sp.]|nr:hypothetical protein [Longimicrobium sp.]
MGKVLARRGVMQTLLAVDLGVRTGLAVYGGDGRLLRYRSQNFGSAARLRRALPALLEAERDLAWVVMEGGGPLAEAWAREAARRGLAMLRISAEDWRRDLLYPREQRSGPQAKTTADALARRVIEWSGAPRPTSLRHDAAEAILVGFWGVLEVGWLTEIPPSLRR